MDKAIAVVRFCSDTVSLFGLLVGLIGCSAFVQSGEIRVISNFECGNGVGIRQLDHDRFTFTARPDYWGAYEGGDDGRQFSQASWYYVRVLGAKNQPITLEIQHLDSIWDGKLNPGGGFLGKQAYPFVSDDGEHWRREPVTVRKRDNALILRVTPRSDVFHVARLEPYSVARHDRFLREIAGHENLTIEIVGQTAEGRPLEWLTITAPLASGSTIVPGSGIADVAASGPAYETDPNGDDRLAIFVRGRAHPFETGSSLATEGLIRFLLSDDPESVRLRQRFVFKIMPMANKDGVVHGNSRINARGDDPNRRWYINSPDDPERGQERIAFRDKLEQWLSQGRSIAFAVDIHNDRDGNIITLKEPYENDPTYRRNIERLGEALRKYTFHRGHPEMHSAHPGNYALDRGVTTAFDRGIYSKWRMFAIVLELQADYETKLGRQVTGEDYLAFGAGLARAMGQFLEE